MTRLRGVDIVVAGAGLAGLSAARALEARGADVTVIEARNRVGGRVWTIRDGFERGQSAEAGADLIEPEQTTLVELAREVGIRPDRILRRGFGYYGPDRRGRLAIQSMEAAFSAMARVIGPLLQAYELSEQRWDTAMSRAWGGQSVGEWLHDIRAPRWLRARCRGLRGLFLADPGDLSLLAFIDFFAGNESDLTKLTRFHGGNDRLPIALARQLQRPVQFEKILRAVHQRSRRITIAIEERGRILKRQTDYLVVTLPASTLRDVQFDPSLPGTQCDAIARLRYGTATRVLLQFDRPFWRRRGRPTAFGTDQPYGAVWDANEGQPGPDAILSLLAGGRASAHTQRLLAQGGPSLIARRLAWLGQPSRVMASRTVVWEDDVWARGGYAVFDPGFDPVWRDWLSRPAGRIVFAGEHTSRRWQGYMNGAVESGQRAAAEIDVMHADRRTSSAE